MAAAFFMESVGCVERVARHKCDVQFQSRLEQFLPFHSGRESHPQEQAALRMSPTRFRWKAFLERGKHHIATFAVNFPNELNVFVQKSIFCNFIGDRLGESGGMQVHSLLELNHFRDYIRWSDDPSKPQPWRQGFRKSAQVNHVSD